MIIPTHRMVEHSPDVAEGWDFFQNEKNASLCIGSVHGEMLMEFIIKIKSKVIFDQSITFAVKNKERLKLIWFEDGRTIKDEILSMSRQREGRARHQNIDHRYLKALRKKATFNIIQHSS